VDELLAELRGGHRPRDDSVRVVATVPALRRRLAATYGVPSMPPHGHPIAELVLTVLSQSTNDRNRDVAYLRLRDRLPDWRAVRDAPVAWGGRGPEAPVAWGARQAVPR